MVPRPKNGVIPHTTTICSLRVSCYGHMPSSFPLHLAAPCLSHCLSSGLKFTPLLPKATCSKRPILATLVQGALLGSSLTMPWCHCLVTHVTRGFSGSFTSFLATDRHLQCQVPEGRAFLLITAPSQLLEC
jgi:hypothetical protein